MSAEPEIFSQSDPAVPVILKDDKLVLLESISTLQRFELQFHSLQKQIQNLVDLSKTIGSQMNEHVATAFKNAGADPDVWVLDKETFLFARKAEVLPEGKSGE